MARTSRQTRMAAASAGLILLLGACSAAGGTVASPIGGDKAAIQPLSAVGDPVQPGATDPAPTVAPATTAAPATTTPPTTAAPTPPPAPETTTTAQSGPILEVAPPLAAPLNALGKGATADDVKAIQQRLNDLGFWAGDVDGQNDWVFQQALMAFQKYSGLSPSGTADGQTVALLNIAQYRGLGQGWDQDQIEVDKGRQLLFIIRGGKTLWIFNTSTGSGKEYSEANQRSGGLSSGTATTPEGNFKVYMEQAQGWWKGDLGELYRPKFFAGGVAVHGAPKVPNFPASHGCVRVTPEAMDFIWAQNFMPKGEPVWVHP
jgi:peptidoglycan hydrolase-like protein with peptidoglycan-binding domain